jgi:hypothetical protein
LELLELEDPLEDRRGAAGLACERELVTGFLGYEGEVAGASERKLDRGAGVRGRNFWGGRPDILKGGVGEESLERYRIVLFVVVRCS